MSPEDQSASGFIDHGNYLDQFDLFLFLSVITESIESHVKADLLIPGGEVSLQPRDGSMLSQRGDAFFEELAYEYIIAELFVAAGLHFFMPAAVPEVEVTTGRAQFSFKLELQQPGPETAHLLPDLLQPVKASRLQPHHIPHRNLVFHLSQPVMVFQPLVETGLHQQKPRIRRKIGTQLLQLLIFAGD